MEFSFLDNNKIVPVVVIKNIEDTLPILNGLHDGGIKVAEITFRTSSAGEAIRLACNKMPNMIIGAGTVINREQCKKAIECGAKFIVSPGFSYGAYKVCVEREIPYIPGVATPTEIILAKELGLSVLKFFPASVYGGVNALKAISSVFPDIKFLPTGGIDENNMTEYLALPCVKAIGGSFMFREGIENIASISRKAVELAKQEG